MARKNDISQLYSGCKMEEEGGDFFIPNELVFYSENDFGSLSRILRENTDPTIQACASRLRHGNSQSPEGAQLITTVVNWNKNDSGAAQFAIAAQNHFEQLNNASDSGYTPLMCAVADGNWTATVALLSLGAQRDAADANGNTLLHIAAERGHVMILEGLLMFLGNEVNRPNADGDMPMHLAARGQHAACLDRLLNTNHLHSNIQV
ncbi:ankyrin repeat protein [Cooperia oncophora]